MTRRKKTKAKLGALPPNTNLEVMQDDATRYSFEGEIESEKDAKGRPCIFTFSVAKQFADFRATDSKPVGWRVQKSNVTCQRRGLGTKFYEHIAEKARKEGAKFLCSDFRLTDNSRGFWEKQSKKERVTGPWPTVYGPDHTFYCLPLKGDAPIDLSGARLKRKPSRQRKR